jgi:hypothetical protein
MQKFDLREENAKTAKSAKVGPVIPTGAVR